MKSADEGKKGSSIMERDGNNLIVAVYSFKWKLDRVLI